MQCSWAKFVTRPKCDVLDLTYNGRAVTPAMRLICGAGLLLTAMGCGSKLTVVTGAVTLDDQPLAAATVIFMPKNEAQSPAQGTTDADGHYTLEQEAGTEGIQPGEYSVRITTFQPVAEDEDPSSAVKEKVPVRYNVQTELTAVVGEQESKEGAFDYPLISGGEIFQPAPDSF